MTGNPKQGVQLVSKGLKQESTGNGERNVSIPLGLDSRTWEEGSVEGRCW